MAKEPMANWMKFVTFLMVILGTVFTWGVAYSSHHSRITNVEKAEAVLAEGVKENGDNLDAHKVANRATKDEQDRKHEAMLERQHQNELMVQRQLTIAETVIKGQEEAKLERKADRATLIKMSEAVIKIQSKVDNLERAD